MTERDPPNFKRIDDNGLTVKALLSVFQQIDQRRLRNVVDDDKLNRTDGERNGE